MGILLRVFCGLGGSGFSVVVRRPVGSGCRMGLLVLLSYVVSSNSLGTGGVSVVSVRCHVCPLLGFQSMRKVQR